MAVVLSEQWQQYITSHGLTLESEMEDGNQIKNWVEAGFTPEEMTQFSKIGAFDVNRAKDLKDFSLEDLAKRVTEDEGTEYSLSYSGYTRAYMYCNGDLSIEQLREIID